MSCGCHTRPAMSLHCSLSHDSFLSSTSASLARGSFRFQSFVPPRGWPILAFFPRDELKLARSHYLIAKRFCPSLLVFVLSSYLSSPRICHSVSGLETF
jgi:hypothetical protein